jgi:hypothetical protein
MRYGGGALQMLAAGGDFLKELCRRNIAYFEFLIEALNAILSELDPTILKRFFRALREDGNEDVSEVEPNLLYHGLGLKSSGKLQRN